MKKTISLALALMLIMSLSLTAFAAENQENVGTGSYNAQVTGKYVAGTTSTTIYSVDITWSDLDFTYHAPNEPVWDPETHTYSDSEDAYWDGEGTITVTNHSNAIITATPAYDAEDAYSTAGMNFSAAKLLLDSAATNNAETVGAITVTPSGSLEEFESTATIGTVTVTIGAFQDVTQREINALEDNAYAFKMEWEGKTVANADAVASGEQYVLTSEYQECFVNIANVTETYRNAFSQNGTVTQDEMNSLYVAALNQFNALVRTKE